ncbi:nuclease-related domain-containing protein [Peribacillus alkalitolerans]|uniref:nuclease-related domain-containing protein n=1 Tax=Peribacillus alkalitolerans TaxID=1550385 RepID=UPI0013D1B013|nr:nuclease-related domain-containing protein [Peribacillus alkalitolerans]
MIKKQRGIPIKILKLEALLKRLPGSHVKRPQIERDLLKSMAGYKGEQSIDYFLDFLSNKSYFILHDLRLPFKNHFFQIDTLILSKSVVIMIEVKNISGTLYFDHTFQQLIRSYNGKEESFPSPFLQVQRQRLQLQQWIADNQFPRIPLEPLIVISNPSTIIKASTSNSNHQLIHMGQLPEKILSIEKIFQKEFISEKDLQKLIRLVKREHSPSTFNVLEYYQINQSEIVTGVQCPSCSKIPMLRKTKKWICQTCETSSNDAFYSSIRDYALLFGHSITNKQLRYFLNLNSRTAALNILKSMNLTSTGEGKSRNYHLSLDKLLS